MVEVNPKCLPGQQVHGDRVGTERIDDHDAELLRGFRHLQPGVPQLNVDGGACMRIRQKGEELRILGNALHGRIDLEEGPLLASLGIGRERAGSQTDDRDPLRTSIILEHLENIADRPLFRVIRQWLAAFVGIEALLAMNGVAMNEIAEAVRLRVTRWMPK